MPEAKAHLCSFLVRRANLKTMRTLIPLRANTSNSVAQRVQSLINDENADIAGLEEDSAQDQHVGPTETENSDQSLTGMEPNPGPLRDLVMDAEECSGDEVALSMLTTNKENKQIQGDWTSLIEGAASINQRQQTSTPGASKQSTDAARSLSNLTLLQAITKPSQRSTTPVVTVQAVFGFNGSDTIVGSSKRTNDHYEDEEECSMKVLSKINLSLASDHVIHITYMSTVKPYLSGKGLVTSLQSPVSHTKKSIR